MNHLLPFHTPILRVLCWSLLLVLPTLTQAQRTCGTMDHLGEQLSSDPGMVYRMRQIEQNAQMVAKSAFTGVPERIRIPVVVHVVYRTAEENIGDAQVFSQIRVLNDDFQRRNRDTSLTPDRFHGVAAGTDIEFVLANRDPSGLPTNGITRTASTRYAFYSSDNGVKYSAMGGKDAWPTDQYLNIWVCNLGAGVLGYAQFPGGPTETDGVVIGYRYFGTTGPVAPPFDRGRTCTHEVGHWLNLRHIWGDGPCDVDDLVADTPPADRPHSGCPGSATACGIESMLSNFMDYTDDACMNLFTHGQIERVRALFGPGGPRQPLLFSQGWVPEAPPVVLRPPTRLDAQRITASEAYLSWEPVTGATAYQVRLRPEGTDRWSLRQFAEPYVTVNGLRACTGYEYQVEGLRDGRSSGFSPSQRFSTTGCVVSALTVPTGLRASLLSEQEASLAWAQVPEADAYLVQYKEAGARRIFSKMVRETNTRIAGLEYGKRYLVRVRAQRGSTEGPFSQILAFVVEGTYASANLRLSPYPDYLHVSSETAGQLRVTYDIAEQAPVRIHIENQQGQTVKLYDPFWVQSGTPFHLYLAELPDDAYVLVIEDEHGFAHRQPIDLR
ncbi:MAG: hypothetical protein OHK0039_08560 [Bacteroidia bacterium]